MSTTNVRGELVTYSFSGENYADVVIELINSTDGERLTVSMLGAAPVFLEHLVPALKKRSLYEDVQNILKDLKERMQISMDSYPMQLLTAIDDVLRVSNVLAATILAEAFRNAVEKLPHVEQRDYGFSRGASLLAALQSLNEIG